MDLVLWVGASMAVATLVVLAMTVLARHRLRSAERLMEYSSQRVEEEFRRVFGDDLPALEPFPRNRRVANPPERPGNRSNWNSGKVRPQG